MFKWVQCPKTSLLIFLCCIYWLLFWKLYVRSKTILYYIFFSSFVSFQSIIYQSKDYTFQYGQVIKLPLQISQCHTVNHMALTNPQRLQFWCNIFTSFLVNLLLDPIGMLIPWLKKSWITNPKLLTRVWTIQNSAYGVVLDCSISC